MVDKNVWYEKLRKNILSRLLLFEWSDPCFGGESFETIIHKTNADFNIDDGWNVYSKKAEGFDMKIFGEKSSVKTSKIVGTCNYAKLTSYRLTKCKTDDEFCQEIERRDSTFDIMFIMLRVLEQDKCMFSFYELPRNYFGGMILGPRTQKMLKLIMKNAEDKAVISFPASKQLSFNIKLSNIETYNSFSFCITADKLAKLRKLLMPSVENLIKQFDTLEIGSKKILSVFDGISCAQIALSKIGAKYEYYASEIEKNSIVVTMKNFPDTKQLGCIKSLKGDDFADTYLLIGGSPCQNLSSRGDKKGLDGTKSVLFYEFVRLLREVKPKYFLLENVGSMSEANKKTISDKLNKVVESRSIKINSKLFIPQNRNRIYWTNIPFNENDLPSEMTQTVQDLLEEKVDDYYYYNLYNKTRSFVQNSYNVNPKSDLKIARTLKTSAYTGRAAVDNCYTTEYTPKDKTNLRKLTPIEFERLQGIPDNYTEGISKTARYKCVGNSFTVPVIEWFLKYIFIADQKEDRKEDQKQMDQLADQVAELKIAEEKLNGLSLFSCAGIAEWLVDNVNFVLANELLEKRCAIYSHFYPDVKMIQGDISEKKAEIIVEAKRLNVKFMLCTPPCQSFSAAGKRNIHDARTPLFIHMIDIIKEVAPHYVLVENVPSFIGSKYEKDNEQTIGERIIAELGNNYNIKTKVLDTKFYGVPQSRKRSITLMSLKTLAEWEYPTPSNNLITVRQTIGHLPSLNSGESSDVHKWHTAKRHNDNHILWMSHTPTGKSAFDNEVHYPQKAGRRIIGYKSSYKRIEWDKPAPTITMTNGSISSSNNVHPGNPCETTEGRLYDNPRVLTVYEIMLLTGLTDWDPPTDDEGFIRGLIGEAVPPMLIKKLMDNMPK